MEAEKGNATQSNYQHYNDSRYHHRGYLPGYPQYARYTLDDREIETRLGLDLVGGVQALLEADLPAEQAIEPQAMQTARSIVENRVNGLGVTEAVVQQAGDRRIVVEIPGEQDPEEALATLKQTGLVEFVDFSSRPTSFYLVGTKSKLILPRLNSSTTQR
jgi:preprotein translocase subunit SecD